MNLIFPATAYRDSQLTLVWMVAGLQISTVGDDVLLVVNGWFGSSGIYMGSTRTAPPLPVETRENYFSTIFPRARLEFWIEWKNVSVNPSTFFHADENFAARGQVVVPATITNVATKLITKPPYLENTRVTSLYHNTRSITTSSTRRTRTPVSYTTVSCQQQDRCSETIHPGGHTSKWIIQSSKILSSSIAKVIAGILYFSCSYEYGSDFTCSLNKLSVIAFWYGCNNDQEITLQRDTVDLYSRNGWGKSCQHSHRWSSTKMCRRCSFPANHEAGLLVAVLVVAVVVLLVILLLVLLVLLAGNWNPT